MNSSESLQYEELLLNIQAQNDLLIDKTIINLYQLNDEISFQLADLTYKREELDAQITDKDSQIKENEAEIERLNQIRGEIFKTPQIKQEDAYISYEISLTKLMDHYRNKGEASIMLAAKQSQVVQRANTAIQAKQSHVQRSNAMLQAKQSQQPRVNTTRK